MRRGRSSIPAPDVLVTDVDMPGLNGLQLARQVRDNPRTAHVPIIIVTSDSEQLRADAAAAGVLTWCSASLIPKNNSSAIFSNCCVTGLALESAQQRCDQLERT